MKILVFNQDWCANEWRAAGHEVHTVGFQHHFDVPNVPPLLHLDTILNTYLPGFQPDRIVFWDNSAPISVIGIEETDIPTFFYSVYVHHHVSYHKYLAHLFDRTFVAQKDYLPELQKHSDAVSWMPLWASRYVEASADKQYGAVFVGNMDAKLNPERVAFFEKLKKVRDVHTTMGEYWKLFPHARLVINQTVKGDLNFRVFETMMCGTVLLTERAQNGLFDIFSDGAHLLTYEKGNVEDAARQIDWVLSHPHEAQAIADAGRNAILNGHLPQHRADLVLRELESLEKVKRPYRGFAAFVNFSILARKMERLDTNYAAKALIHALKVADEACKNNEPLSNEIAYLLVLSAVTYDRFFASTAGECLIEKLSDAYPNENVLHLARIRSRLNRGDFGNASELAKTYFDDTPQQTFRNAETIVTTILSDLIQT